MTHILNYCNDGTEKREHLAPVIRMVRLNHNGYEVTLMDAKIGGKMQKWLNPYSPRGLEE